MPPLACQYRQHKTAAFDWRVPAAKPCPPSRPSERHRHTCEPSFSPPHRPCTATPMCCVHARLRHMPWPRRRTRSSEVQLQREVDGLRTTICCLKRELETKQDYAAKLELLLHQRTETIDALNGKLEQSREQ